MNVVNHVFYYFIAYLLLVDIVDMLFAVISEATKETKKPSFFFNWLCTFGILSYNIILITTVILLTLTMYVE